MYSQSLLPGQLPVGSVALPHVVLLFCPSSMWNIFYVEIFLFYLLHMKENINSNMLIFEICVKARWIHVKQI